MPDEEVSNEESEEEKIEGFIPRLKDEIKLIGQRESYRMIRPVSLTGQFTNSHPI